MAQSKPKQLDRHNYHVAWICPGSEVNLDPPRLMLDEEHDSPEYDADYDDNTYICGSMAGHNVVLATTPAGMRGNVTAGHLTRPLYNTFPHIKLTVLVGIGGGVPSAVPSDNALEDIHLGDVVVGWPGDGKPAVVYYESGRSHVDDKFEILGTINRPDWALVHALSKLQSDHRLGRTKFGEHFRKLQADQRFAHPGLQYDNLFRSGYKHQGAPGDCAKCKEKKIVYRVPRTEDQKNQLVFHTGRIGTGNSIVLDGKKRDRISNLCEGIQCIEMSAAGVDASRNCLVIRGISDYCDSHKNGVWKSYAAATATVFARELLGIITPTKVKGMKTVTEDTRQYHCLIPFDRNETFVGREPVLNRLLERIPPSANKDACQRTVIEGLGGVGKTQIALEAAYQVRDKYSNCHIFWVPALDATAFENAYRGIGDKLKVQGIDNDKADVKKLVKEALNRESIGMWILIIDNADDLELLFGDIAISESLPTSRNGSILFTTRTREAAVRLDIPDAGITNIAELSRTESLQLLGTRLHDTQISDDKSTNTLLDLLLDLPLAIKQASVYMAISGMSTTEYLAHCQSSDRTLIRLLSKDFEDRGRYKTTLNPVATTWLISFQHILRDKPLAAEYLKFICFLALKDIPQSILPPAIDKLEAREAVGALEAYGFITGRGNLPVFDTHRLVALSTRNWLRQERSALITRVIRRLDDVSPAIDHEHREAWSKWLPHAEEVLKYQEESRATGVTGSLLNRVGGSYSLLGRYEAAEAVVRQALEIRRKVLGPDHPNTLQSLINLGSALAGQRKSQEAATIHRQALKVTRKVLGPDHPDTLSSLSNLGVYLSDQGKHNKAKRIHRQALEIRRKVLGPDHPNTLSSLNNLGVTLSDQGKYNKAKRIYRQALEIRTKVLGPDHPDTLTSLYNLGATLSDQGKYNEAKRIYRQALEISRKVLGPDHPNTLKSLYNLGVTLSDQGKYNKAKRIYRQALEISRKVLGPDHPRTLESLNNLGVTLSNRGKYNKAKRIHRQALEIRRKVLGPDHPNTLSSLDNLGVTLSNQGKYNKAKRIYRQALEIRIKVLGPDHPDTLTSLYNLGATLSDQGKYNKAKRIYRQALEISRKVLGPDHPDTLKSLYNLQVTLRRQGRDEQAEELGSVTARIQDREVAIEPTVHGIWTILVDTGVGTVKVIIDWDQRRVISVATAWQEDDEDFFFDALAEHIDEISSDIVQIEIGRGGELLNSVSDLDMDRAMIPFYPSVSDYPEGVSRIQRGKLIERERMGVQVDLCETATSASSIGDARKIASKYYMNESNMNIIWHEANCLLRIPKHPNIVPLDCLVVDRIEGQDQVVGFATPFMPGGTILDNVSRTFKLVHLRQLTDVIDYLNFKLGVVHGDVTPLGWELTDDNDGYDPDRSDVKFTASTLYEIITRDMHFREEKYAHELAVSMILNQAQSWEKHENVRLDAAVSEYRSHLEEWMASRMNIDKNMTHWSWASEAIDWPPLSEFPEVPFCGAMMKRSTQMKQEMVRRGAEFVKWQRPSSCALPIPKGQELLATGELMAG